MTECINWAGQIGNDGYGRYSDLMAHRVIYESEVGPIPEGLQIDHLCRNHACVNVEHLEPVTQQENARRGRWGSATECVHGHPFDEANTYIRPNGRRSCRRCNLRRVNEYQRRRSA